MRVASAVPLTADPFLIAADLLDPPIGAWRAKARPEQLPPPGDWHTWYVRGGRGSGKTWTGGNWLAEQIKEHPGQQWACIAPTFSDARDVMIEGAKSGLLAALGLPRNYPGWNRSQGQLWLPDSTVVFCDGANDGAYRIQGKNLAGAWCDEIGLWVKWAIAWDESISFAVRMDPARIIATGTPKRGHPLVKRLIEDQHVPKTLLRTMDNIANLSKTAIDDLVRRFKGTNLEAQELEGELLDEAEGALWTFDEARKAEKGLIVHGKPPTYQHRVGTLILNLPDFLRTVVAVDPAISSSGDEWGIIILASGRDGKIYVRGDRSAQCSPEEAAKRIVQTYHDFEADRIVYEDNQGGEMVKTIIDQVERNLPISRVHAYHGKSLRAEPVQHAYQQGRVIHEEGVDLSELEGQMVGWEPLAGMPSPDRLDAHVHGVRALDDGTAGRVVHSDASPFD